MWPPGLGPGWKLLQDAEVDVEHTLMLPELFTPGDARRSLTRRDPP